MKRHVLLSLFPVLACTLTAAEPPVAFPKLEHYAPLWERSIFTTKDLPSPDVPSGPIFTDSLGLSGIYEVDGQVVAVLIDKTTSQFSEARIGSENEHGIKIRKVQPGATLDKTRIQLQKGDIAGWVGFAEAAAPAVEPAPQVRPAQPAHAPAATPLLPPPAAAPAQPLPVNPAPPPSVRSVPPAQPTDDVPLPPS